MGTSTEDRARLSQLEVYCRVEEQALVEQEVEGGADTVVRDNESTGNAERTTRPVGLSNTIAAEEEH